MNRYYLDKMVAFNLDGIRAVQVINNTYDDRFALTVTYKGNHFNVKYPSRFDRDMAFNSICTELERRKIGEQKK